MAAAPDDDARRTLAELEAKLRELERELLRGRDPEPPPTAEEPPAPEPHADAAPQPDPYTAFPPSPTPEPDAPESPTGAPQADPFTAFPPSPAPEPDAAFPEPAGPEPDTSEPPADAAPPPPALDLAALADAREMLAGLRATMDELGATVERITVETRAVVEDHGRTLARLDLAARAAAKAEEAAAEAGRVASTVVVEAGPFADPAPLLALRDALAAQPGTHDAYVRGVENGRAVIEVHLAPPSAPPSTPAPGT
jgi:hypothetical protein